MGHLDVQCPASTVDVSCSWVRSLLKGEKSLPKYDRRREGAIKEYEEIVRKMHSEYVTVCFPSRPLESTPNTSFSNEGSQSQNPYRS
ncbi:hypothetical protein ABBQ32_002641 [Trebouxia sp. C0010 RCD-2024]